MAAWRRVLLPTLLLLAGSWAGGLRAGEIVRAPDGHPIIRIKLWSLPDATRTDPASRAVVATVDRFRERFPEIIRERYRDKYRADPGKYGDYDWDRVEIQLERFSGITVAGLGMDSGILMAIAGGVAPDVVYVNFRQSDTYIQQGFVYPLDQEGDGTTGKGYLADIPPDELAFRVHEQIWPVIRRKGPGGQTHVWAMPYDGALGKVVVYRRDLFDEAGVPYPTNDWTWEQFLDYNRRITDPANGIYGTMLGKGMDESWFWVTFLWSAGGDALAYDEATDQWRAIFDSRAAAVALDFYLQLCAEPWTDKGGVARNGYAYRDTDRWRLFDEGKLAMSFQYIEGQMFTRINPDVLGMVPVPWGYPDEHGVRHRGGELNSRMQGIFAGIEHPAVRDAAWEYIRYSDSLEAWEIRTRIMVEGGLGRFLNPATLERFGYGELVRLTPKQWRECFDIAIATGKPEPYGRNCQLIYTMMTVPMQEAEEVYRKGELPSDPEQRLARLQGILHKAVLATNEKTIGVLPPGVVALRRVVAAGALLLIVAAFTLVFRRIIRAFTPPLDPTQGPQVVWGLRKYRFAYLILLPALLSVFVWQYLPLALGSVMAFQDFRIMGGSQWVWLDNFANVLFDERWWRAVYNSLRYSFLVISLTFLPPIVLAILLQEVPVGKIFFRTLYYLPAVINGLVVTYLWKSFYEESERGILNAIVMRIPAGGFIIAGVVVCFICWQFAQRLWQHELWVTGWLFVAAGLALFYASYSMAHPILFETDVGPLAGLWQFVFNGAWLHQPFTHVGDSVRGLAETVWGCLREPWRLGGFTARPYRWLTDPSVAMTSCVIPMVWAGMGPGCLIYLAALKGISDDLYEAADIDGATFIDKILFVVFPTLRPLIIINFVGVFIGSWLTSADNIMVMTGGAGDTNVAGLEIFYKAYMYLNFGPATAMAWVLGCMMIGFTMHQLRMLSRLEFRAQGMKT